MNKTLLWIALILAGTLLVGIYVYSENTRYYIQGTGKGAAYKIDRKTGKVWFVVRNKQISIVNKDPETPEEKAINLAKDSTVLDQSGLLSNSYMIKKQLEKEKEAIDIVGWQVLYKENEETYQVVFEYKTNGKSYGYRFQVNLPTGIVRNLTGKK